MNILTVLVTNHHGGATIEGEFGPDLHSCFNTFHHDFRSGIRREMVKQYGELPDGVLAQMMRDAEVYSDTTATVDIIVSIRKLRKALSIKPRLIG